MKQSKLDKAVRALLGLPGVKHKRPPPPTKADLNRKFVMRTDRKGKARIEEITDE